MTTTASDRAAPPSARLPSTPTSPSSSSTPHTTPHTTPSASSFARRTGLVAAGQAAVKATQLVLAIVLVRLLAPAEWNATAFLLSIYLAGTTIGTLNVQHGIVFFLPRVDPDQRRSLVLRTMALLLAIGFLITGALTVAAPALSGGRLADAGQLPWLGLAIALELPAVCIPMTMIALHRFAAAAVWDLAGTAIVLACTVVPAAAGAGASGIVAGLVVAGAVRLTAGTAVTRRAVEGRRVAPHGIMADQFRYALPLGLTLAVSMLNRLVDKWYIAAFRPGDFGVYAVAAQEIPLLAVLPYAGGAALITSLVAAFRDDDLPQARAHWLHLTMTMSTVVVPLGVALVLVAPEVITLVFTDDFGAGVLPFQLFTLVTIHRVAEYGMLLRAAGHTRDLLQVAGLTLAANAVLACIGAATAGMVGASLGTLAASALGWWFVMRRVAAVLELPVRDAFAWRAWLSCVGLAASAAIATAVALAPVPLATDGRLAVKLIVFTALYTAGLRWWRSTRHSAMPAAAAVAHTITRQRATTDRPADRPVIGRTT